MDSTIDQSIFRNYDMRGIYPSQMDEKIAYQAAQAFVELRGAKIIVAGRDVRTMGESMLAAAIQGARDAGAKVIEIGVISTEMLYFAAATIDCDGGLSVTASHNPKEWTGIKFIGAGAIPMYREGGLQEIYDYINVGRSVKAEQIGEHVQQNILQDYIEYLRRYNPTPLPQGKIAVNVNFGANGKVLDGALKDWPVELVRLNWNEDGNFPKGTPDPSLPSNRKEILDVIKTEKADYGVAFDADADRIFFYDENGRYFHAYYINALLIKHFLELEPEAKVVCERRLVYALKDSTKPGQIAYTRSGHSYIKAALREHNAIYGGEVSGHFYFRDFFYCDCGMVTFMIIADIFSKELAAGRKISTLLDQFIHDYPANQAELNYITPDANLIIDETAKKYADAEQNHLDGLTVDYPDWHLNLRTSSNEPVLRLNLEAKTPEKLAQVNEEVQAFILAHGATLRDDN